MTNKKKGGFGRGSPKTVVVVEKKDQPVNPAPVQKKNVSKEEASDFGDAQKVMNKKEVLKEGKSPLFLYRAI
jgi:hypothetical protein